MTFLWPYRQTNILRHVINILAMVAPSILASASASLLASFGQVNVWTKDKWVLPMLFPISRTTSFLIRKKLRHVTSAFQSESLNVSTSQKRSVDASWCCLTQNVVPRCHVALHFYVCKIMFYNIFYYE